MDSLPFEVVNIIHKWVIEFNRVDAIERYVMYKPLYTDIMLNICEDIRLNVPYYTFYIDWPNEKLLTISVFIPDCNPCRSEPETVYIQRRSLSVPHITGNFISDI